MYGYSLRQLTPTSLLLQLLMRRVPALPCSGCGTCAQLPSSSAHGSCLRPGKTRCNTRPLPCERAAWSCSSTERKAAVLPFLPGAAEMLCSNHSLSQETLPVPPGQRPARAARIQGWRLVSVLLKLLLLVGLLAAKSEYKGISRIDAGCRFLCFFYQIMAVLGCNLYVKCLFVSTPM